ncbi:MAG: 2OG-Fe(II) oxygenase [Rudaea sp.]|nr:2OG-Fe(II) oxygenase [Rudaea sp.]
MAAAMAQLPLAVLPELRMLNPQLHSDAGRLAARFRERDPFRHVVIDDFLAADACASLLAQFPPFERGNARNEAGEVGAKSTVEKIRTLGPAYAALDDLIQTREFLDLIGRVTGIPGLRYDPWYFGGGTHENRAGQDLDAHVDFNRHPVERWHRRLNLIVYLNHEWDDAWGGSLELHSDPRAADDRVTRITPLYNRAVIFETTEWSWHGFTRIALPEEKKSLSRKSIALYFYTTERPQDELADTHSTIYVDRPLPERFRPGLTLGAADVEELRILLARRDQHNKRLYRDTTALTAQLEQAQAALHGGRLGRLRYLAEKIIRGLRAVR